MKTDQKKELEYLMPHGIKKKSDLMCKAKKYGQFFCVFVKMDIFYSVSGLSIWGHCLRVMNRPHVPVSGTQH